MITPRGVKRFRPLMKRIRTGFRSFSLFPFKISYTIIFIYYNKFTHRSCTTIRIRVLGISDLSNSCSDEPIGKRDPAKYPFQTKSFPKLPPIISVSTQLLSQVLQIWKSTGNIVTHIFSLKLESWKLFFNRKRRKSNIFS